MCGCGSPEARARKQAHKEARKAAFAKLFNSSCSSKRSQAPAASPEISYRSAPRAEAPFANTREQQQYNHPISGNPIDEKTGQWIREPPSYDEAMGKEEMGFKNEKVAY